MLGRPKAPSPTHGKVKRDNHGQSAGNGNRLIASVRKLNAGVRALTDYTPAPLEGEDIVGPSAKAEEKTPSVRAT